MMLDDELAKVERYRAALLAAIEARAVFVQDAAESAQDAPGEAIAVDQPIVPADPPSLAGDATAPEEPTNTADRPCAYCDKPLPTTKPRGTRRDYCNNRCRQKAWAARKAEREAAADRAQAAAILAQHASEGYETTLKWRATNGQA
jgi:hypothetical protein